MDCEQYLVSVLVPVYGIEKYIERCANSIFRQTYQNLEIIFVNDCTKDDSIQIIGQVLDRFPERKAQVKIVNHDKNRGLAAARNTAVQTSTGLFLIHIDGDDWVESDLIERCVEIQIKTGADIISTDFFIHKQERIVHEKETSIQDTKEMLNQLLYGNINGHIWGRLIRSSIYKNNHIKIKEGANYGEDLLGMSFLLFYSSSHGLVKKALYNYNCQNLSSYTNNFSSNSSKQSLENIDVARAFFQRNDSRYLKGVDRMELAKISAHMIQCVSNGKNKDYYHCLQSRLYKIDKTTWKMLPFKYRFIFYFTNYSLAMICVKMARVLQKIVSL